MDQVRLRSQRADRHAAAGERGPQPRSHSRPVPAMAIAMLLRSVLDGRIKSGSGFGLRMGADTRSRGGAAAPILFDAFARTGKLPAALRKPPKGALVVSNAKLPLPLRRFLRGGTVRAGGGRRRTSVPLNGSRIDVDRSPGQSQFSAMPVGSRRRTPDDDAGERRRGG